MKTYKADTEISVMVTLANGVNKRISFNAITTGESYYSTSDKEIQKALEKHYRYGTLFRVEEEKDERLEEKKNGEEELNGGADDIKGRLIFNDEGEAKEYLCTTYNLPRTKIRGIKSIMAAAETLGIEIEIK